ncbi:MULTISPECIES: CaiB/BaiF CoA transferase family protein [Peribacillus]|uniref:CaiB/BaiF CoA transferase family protein n=1 Tax=Peribacillus TaxID=2675229 RepID=UPI001F4D9652|nr:CoA transferase [Peribacillus sp. Aquil_B1]MCK2006569.1 CoA transferase [Peribacillus sp. Aquil_B8]
MGALSGVKVLDLSRLLPGPYCSLMMADYGAEVIKIEEPDLGDYIRWRKPAIEEIGARHLTINRNKKSVELNLKTEEGKEIFKKMAESADVILESFRPGVMSRLGIGFEEISKINRGIVYCSLTGYGQTGPYRDLPGHDINYIGYSGILGLIGEKNGKPVVPGVQIADVGGGALMALSGICMALFNKERTGKGQYIDVSMMDGAVTWLYAAASDYFASGKVPERGENRLDGQYAFYQVYETKDNKYLSVGASEKKFWKKICELIGKPEWIELHGGNDDVQEQLKLEMSEIFKKKNQQEWLDLLALEETCVGPVNDIEQIFSDPQIIERELFTEMEHPVAGNIKQIGFPIKFSETPGKIHSHAPILGEHTEEILQQLDYSSEAIENLRISGVIGKKVSTSAVK